MSDAVKVGFVPFSASLKPTVVVFCDDTLKFGATALKTLGTAAGVVKRAAAASQFKGKSGAILDVLASEGIKVQRLIVIGTGKPAELKDKDFLKFGGVLAGKLNAGSEAVTVVAELPDGAMTPVHAAAVASGIRLRAYKFDRYKTKKKDGEDGVLRADVSLAVSDVAATRKAFAPEAHIVDGVIIARELVNEPPNVLYPEEFARRAAQLRKLGVVVEILDVKAMTKLGMGALLGVAQGSARPGRTVIMRWNGGKRGEPPVAFVGKGVCFDTGGISIKPAGSMEDMKGDMGGRGLCGRADACAGGAQGQASTWSAPSGWSKTCPTAMPSVPATSSPRCPARPSKSSIPTPKAASCWPTCSGMSQTKFKPQIHGRSGDADRRHHGGARHRNMPACSPTMTNWPERLIEAGEKTGERVWRMPLGPEYDKLIDSQIRRHEEHRRPPRRLDHGGAIPAALRRQDAVGASRHRGHGAGLAANRNQPQLGFRLWRTPAGPAGDGILRSQKIAENPMTEVLFYHLQNMSLESVLPPLLEKSLERGWRVVVQIDFAGARRCARCTSVDLSRQFVPAACDLARGRRAGAADRSCRGGDQSKSRAGQVSH